MAKPWKDGPLKVSARYIYDDAGIGISIRTDQHDKAIERLAQLVPRFDDEFILMVAAEIGLDEAVTYTPDMNGLDLDMTSLQLVAMAAALRACADYRDGRPREVIEPEQKKRKESSEARPKKRSKKRRARVEEDDEDEGITW